MELFTYKYILGLSVVLFTLCMTSGQMWNHMRKPISILRDHKGIITYIYPNSSYQLLYESYIIFMLYIMLVFGFLLLNKSCIIKSCSIKCQILAFSSYALMMCSFGVILSIFTSKFNGYPYSLLDAVIKIYEGIQFAS